MVWMGSHKVHVSVPIFLKFWYNGSQEIQRM